MDTKRMLSHWMKTMNTLPFPSGKKNQNPKKIVTEINLPPDYRIESDMEGFVVIDNAGIGLSGWSSIETAKSYAWHHYHSVESLRFMLWKKDKP